MRVALLSFMLGVGMVFGGAPIHGAGAAEEVHPQIGSHVVFLYYKDLNAAVRFYEDLFGLPKVYDQGWVKMYRVTPGSYIGLIDEAGKGYHKAPTTTPSVMVSIETTELDAWYRRLKGKGATFLIEPDPNKPHEVVQSVLLKDPGGYTIEFFRWIKRPDAFQ